MRVDLRLARLEHAAQVLEATISTRETDPWSELLKRLERTAERLAHVRSDQFEQMSPAERMCRAALEVGAVGSDAFRRELSQLLTDWTNAYRQDETRAG